MSVAQIFEKLEQNFNADAAEGLDLVFQFDIEDDKTYHLVIKDGTCKMAEGAHDDPSVTLIMNSETLQGIAWLLLVFFIFALIAYVIVRIFESRKGR